MNWRVVSVQITTLIVVLVMAAIIYVKFQDSEIRVSTINESGTQLNSFTLSYGEETCAVSSLLSGGWIHCTFTETSSTNFSILARTTSETVYEHESIGYINPGKSNLHLMTLKPDDKIKFEIKTLFK